MEQKINGLIIKHQNHYNTNKIEDDAMNYKIKSAKWPYQNAIPYEQNWTKLKRPNAMPELSPFLTPAFIDAPRQDLNLRVEKITSLSDLVFG